MMMYYNWDNAPRPMQQLQAPRHLPAMFPNQYYAQPVPTPRPQFNYHQRVVQITNQEIPTIVLDDDETNTDLNRPQTQPHCGVNYNQYSSSEPLKADSVEITGHTLPHPHYNGFFNSRNHEYWADLNVKEDPCVYENDEAEKKNLDQEREWIDWTELNVKEDIKGANGESCIVIEDDAARKEDEVKEGNNIINEDDKKDPTRKEDEGKNTEEAENENCIIIEDREGPPSIVIDDPEATTNRQTVIEPQNKIKCDYCSYETEWVPCLSRHLTTKHRDIRPEPEENDQTENTAPKESGNEKFQCKDCPYKTNWKGNMTKHVISRHTNVEEIKWYECAHCSYKGKTREYLLTHLGNCHEKFVKWYNCKQCSYRTKINQTLNNHVIVNHTDEKDIKWFKCSHCPYKAKIASNLRHHIFYQHTDDSKIKWQQCEMCPYKSKTKKGLKKHMHVHNEEDRIFSYSCDKCSGKFPNKKVLSKHFNSVHRNNGEEVQVDMRHKLCLKRVPSDHLVNNKTTNQLCKCKHCQPGNV